ncbi:hypothetical protein Patl1_10589 [Pistacia atlantica]|uniref:Uncharacterized protein n=1 Tax=Pistacia atlantica TaxID=434234 RepID=A0ACC1A8U8_9ROSI|nr:hypothetical protein Patl1_10589 [Pistacia atlantica]
MGVKVGEEVGYTIRFEDLTKKGVTMIKFLTDGVLLREMMDDPLLTKYSVIMVDEAHERSISTDILLGLLKKIQRRRPQLRLIISSATIEAKSMSSFFQARKNRRGLEGEEFVPKMEPAILSVEGRGFNVQIHYVEEPVSDYVQAAVSTVVLINDQASRFIFSIRHFLVFMLDNVKNLPVISWYFLLVKMILILLFIYLLKKLGSVGRTL